MCWGGGEWAGEVLSGLSSESPAASCHERSEARHGLGTLHRHRLLAFLVFKPPLTLNTVYLCVRLITRAGDVEDQKRS